jgi:hypothetical protein
VVADLLDSPVPQLINDLQLKLRTKADRYSSAGTAVDSSTKADRQMANANVSNIALSVAR